MLRTRLAVAAPAAGAAALLLAAAPALASGTNGSAQADLAPLNDSGGTGSAMVQVDGTTLEFTLAASGLLADAPHAAHIHYGEDAMGQCPTADADEDGDGFLTTSEGAPFYGGIVVSLTTEGDTSPDSGLAVDRFGVGDDISYSRGDVEVSAEVAEDILSGEAVVVVHGVDHDGDGAYSEGERGASDLDPSLPGEATDPALCGVLQASQMTEMPAGGVDTGEAEAAGRNIALAAGGALALAGGAYLVARRRTADDS
ncbi:CHRD domain-containing protein [Aquipuribacter nitratireducens]|uniref:CHRD domain-containing protein n=1 Tax=Aquipuribacter nitratireducens TaxID=650104 RepID=A0ABW0GPI9_9MICO